MIKSLRNYAPTLGQCWIILFLIFVGQILSGILLQGTTQSLVYFASFLIPYGFILLMARKAPEDTSRPINRANFGKLPGVVAFLVAAVIMQCISIMIEPISGLLPMPESVKKMFESLFYGTSVDDLIIATCVLAPFIEEFLCRGVMLRGLKKYVSPTSAIIWSSVLFAVMHANPWQAIPAFVMGVFFGWVYHRTGCLWLTIFLHTLNNTISAVMTRAFPEVGVDTGLKDLLGSYHYWCVYFGAVVLFIMLIYFFHEKTLSPEVRTRS